jgi:hypothetical protein
VGRGVWVGVGVASEGERGGVAGSLRASGVKGGCGRWGEDL